MKIKYHSKLEQKRDLFFDALEKCLYDHVLSNRMKINNLEMVYKLLYHSGNIKDKLTLVYQEDCTTTTENALHKLFTSHDEAMFQDFEHIQRFETELELFVRNNFGTIQTANKPTYSKLIGQGPDFSHAIYTIHFEEHLAIPEKFKLHLEKLYSIIKRVFYRVKFGVATEYNNLGPLDYHVFLRHQALQIQFRHRLLMEENNQYPCVKLVFSGLHAVLEIIEAIIKRILIHIPQAIDPDGLEIKSLHFPIVYPLYGSLNKKTREFAIDETQKVIENLIPFLRAGSIQQTPELKKSI